MKYIIIIGIVFVVLCFALSFIAMVGSILLFHPVVNSVFTAAFLIFLKIRFLPDADFYLLLLMAVVLADCIRDIAVGSKYYRKFDVAKESDKLYTFDKLYVIKSLTSLLTIGAARVIFLLIVNPILSHAVKADVEKRMAAGLPLPLPDIYSKLQAKNYYYNKSIEKLSTKNAIVSNAATADREIEKRRKRLDDLYPKKLVEKVTDMVAGDKDVKENRQRAEERLKFDVIKTYYAYLSAPVYNRLPQLLSDVMQHKGCFSPSDIQKFDELRELNLTAPVGGHDGGSDWSEYFIIQALEPLVVNGTFSDDGNLSDKDPFETHAYVHTSTSTPRKSQSPETNPLLALDDDD